MKKKLFIIAGSCIALALAIFLICYYNIPRLEYEYNSTSDSYYVYKAFGNAKSYTVKEMHKGKKVTGISTRAFYRHHNLEEVIFENEENIIFIGRLAFSECENLSSIDLSYAEEIERNAFSYDKSLVEVTLQAKYIGAAAFYQCDNLASVVLKEGTLSLGQNAFSRCSSLQELRIPKSCKNIYQDCFSNSGIKRIYCSEDLKNNKYLMTLDYVIYE